MRLSSAFHIVIIFVVLAVTFACRQPETTNQHVPDEQNTGELRTDEIVSGLNHPWGMAFLPDGRMLVTERSGTLRILDLNNNNTLSDPLQGTPEVRASGQGGMLDVALDPDFSANQQVWLSYSEPGSNNTATTTVGHGRLDGNRLNDFTVVFRKQNMVRGGRHFGSRIIFANDGTVFITLGDRGEDDMAQDPTNHIGTIVRINRDGTVPADNPFVNDDTILPEIYSYGHRNIQAAAINPADGRFWVGEMGPRDGDELNLPQAGKNYGWPEVSWGRQYSGTPIPDPPTRPEFEQAVMQWTPVISPSGMEFYTGDMFPDWNGLMLIGGLTTGEVVFVRINGIQAEEVNRIDMGARVRDVKQAPDGSVYVITDESNGKVLRMSRE